mgnify:FL=1
MNIHNDAMDLLKYIYDGLSEGYDSYNVSEDKLEAMSPNDRTSFLASVNYLKQENFVKPYAEYKGVPVSVKITSKGIKAIEKISTVQPTTNIIVNSNVSGIVGQNIAGNTINQGLSIADFQAILQANISDKQDLQKIQEELAPLFKRMEIGSPLEKGLLSSAKEHLENYQTIYGSLLQVIGTYLLAK